MSREGVDLTGLSAFKHKVVDAFYIPYNSIPGARLYGSKFNLMIDENLDNDFSMSVYEEVTRIFNEPVNGLSNGTVKDIRINYKDDNLTVSIDVDYLGKIINIGNIKV